MSQAPGMTFEQRDIVLVPFPYSDLSYSKKRPVLILSNNDYNNRYEDKIVCVLTSNLYLDEYSLPLKNESLEYGYLPEESCIKVHKIFTVHQSKIIKKFSKVDLETFQGVLDRINDLFRKS